MGLALLGRLYALLLPHKCCKSSMLTPLLHPHSPSPHFNMVKVYKGGKVCVVLQGRFAGRKVSIQQRSGRMEERQGGTGKSRKAAVKGAGITRLQQAGVRHEVFKMGGGQVSRRAVGRHIIESGILARGERVESFTACTSRNDCTH